MNSEIERRLNSIENRIASYKHSIVQELVDEGAYDVAIKYVEFLKNRSKGNQSP